MQGALGESSTTILPALVITVAVLVLGVAVAFGSPTNLLCPLVSLVYSHWTEGRAARVGEAVGEVEALGVAEALGDEVGFAQANGLGVDEKPPSPMLTERAAMAANEIRTPMVPLLKVGFGSIFG